MAKEELQFILSAKDNASPVFNKVGKNASKSLGDVEKQATTSGTKAATGFGGAFSKGIGAAGSMGLDKFLAVGAVAGAFKFAITAASSLQEATSKSNAVFRENAGEIQKWAKTASTAFGQSQAQALEAAGTFGNLFQAFGVGLQPATEMSKTLTELASDLASFNNTSVQEAIEALRSGLSGETEPLKRYGVALTDARLKQEALGLGLISDVKRPLDAAAKSQAAYSLIMKDTALAQGDFQRTAGDFANSMKTLQANITNAAAAIGADLLPPLAALAKYAAKGIDIAIRIQQPDFSLTGSKDFDMGLRNLFSSAENLLNPLKNLQTNIPILEGWFGSSGEAADQAASAISRLGTSKGRAWVATQQLAAAEADAIATSAGMVAAKGREQEANAGVAASLERTNNALQANIDKQLAAIDSTFAVTAATNSFLTSNQAAASAVDDTTSAVNEQQQAIDGATQDAIRAASATAAYAQQQAGLTGKTLSAKQSQDVLIGTLQKLASQASGPVASAIGAVITKLQAVGAQKPKPTITVNDQTAGPMQAVNNRISALNGRSATISVNVLTGGALNSINAIQNAFNRLPKNFTGAAPTLKTGGPVPGAVNQPVPVLAHGGEYVLSADVVDRIKRGDASRGASASLSLPSGGGGGGVVVNFNGTFLASKAELGRMVDEALAESRRRGNRAA